MSETPFSEDALRDIAEKKVSYRRSVKIHWSVYLLVNAMIFVINLFTMNFDLWLGLPDTSTALLIQLWAIYPILGWFIGAAVHTTVYLLYANGVYPMAKRAVILHFVAYLTVMLLLVVINAITYPAFFWVLFPLIFWGIGVIIHYIVYRVYFRGEISKKTGEAKSRKEQAIEKEMEKMRKKMQK
ncbi:MAG: 2TM domain-containing protein [Promethearchaeota archaeon]|nr:MAG: 2TM domain-containing protein [Candidatus Lokiarchaeota archaeon]